MTEKGPLTIQTDAVMARVGERTDAYVSEAMRRQREELTREWVARQADQEARDLAGRQAAVKHWTGLVSFALAALGATGAFVSWWSGRVRATALEEVRQETMGARLQELEDKLDACTGGER